MLAVVVLVGITVSACAASSTPLPKPQRTVGILTGMASPCWPYPTNKGIEKAIVKVEVSKGENTVATQSVTGSHIYHFTLKPGTYVVSTPYSRPQPVTIAIGRTAHVDLPDDCV